MRNNRIWLWGFTIDRFPESISAEETTWCSVETAARYLQADNIMASRSTYAPELLDDEHYWACLKDAKELMMPLSHVPMDDAGETWDVRYLETAEKIARRSLADRRITSVVIDDFRDIVGPSRDMKAEELAEVYRLIKRINPALQLHLVRYAWQDQNDLEDVRDFFDVISYWNMTTSVPYWQCDYIRDVQMLARRFKKPVFSGVYLHNYANCNGCAEGSPMPLETCRVMLPNVFHALRSGIIGGVMFLHNGWLSREDHRESIRFVHDYIDHYLGVHTFLER